MLSLNLGIWAFARARREDPPATPPPSDRVDLDAYLEAPSRHATDFFGVVLTGDTILIEPKVEARVLKVRVRVGESVRQGALIAELDRNGRDQELLSARAAVRDAKRRYARRAALARGDEATVSVEELDAARTQLAQERGRLGVLEAALAETRLLAPADGTISEVYLAAGALTGPSKPLARLIARRDDVRVRFAIPEAQAGAVARGDQVEVRVPSLAVQARGNVVGVNPEVDVASRMIYAVANLELPATARGLTTGVVARVRPQATGRTLVLSGETADGRPAPPAMGSPAPAASPRGSGARPARTVEPTAAPRRVRPRSARQARGPTPFW